MLIFGHAQKFDFFTPYMMKIRQWKSQSVTVKTRHIGNVVDIDVIENDMKIQHHVISARTIDLPPEFKIHPPTIDIGSLLQTPDPIILYLVDMELKQEIKSRNMCHLVYLDKAGTNKINYASALKSFKSSRYVQKSDNHAILSESSKMLRVHVNGGKSMAYRSKSVMLGDVHSMMDSWGEKLNLISETTSPLTLEQSLFYDIYSQYTQIMNTPIHSLHDVVDDMIGLVSQINLLIRNWQPTPLRDEITRFKKDIQKVMSSFDR